MISSEVQRTLVKSPPELWSELSDPESLARHLGELGDIRIVRVEPEKKVEWAAENTTGTVSIQPSGWGTKVTLSVTRELVAPPGDTAPQAVEASPEDILAPEAVIADPPAEPEVAEPAEMEPQAVEMEAQAVEADLAAQDPDAPPETAGVQPPAESEAQPEELAAQPDFEVETKPRLGFFARLFGRRRREQLAPEPISSEEPGPLDGADEPAEDSVELTGRAPRAFAAVSEALAREAAGSDVFALPTGSASAPEPAAQTDVPEPRETSATTSAEASADIAAELMAAEEVDAEEVAAEEVTAVLAAVLDRLGAAHHRPFSRS